MKSRQILFSVTSAFLILSMQATTAGAAGYEKAVQWSGRYNGVGGAAAANVRGAESIYFNPAGLSTTKGIEVTGNISPTLARFYGPVLSNGEELASKSQVTFPFGVTGSYAVNDRFGLGLGVYSAGGTAAIYEDLASSALDPTFRSNSKSSVKVIEVAIGAAYSITPQLRLGVAWRPAFVSADFSTNLGGGNIALDAEGLKDTQLNGFKVGLQWQSEDEHTGLGVNWRTPLKFTVEDGEVTGRSAVPGSTVTVNDLTVKNQLPQQISIGGYNDFTNANFRLVLEYTFTQYAKNRQLEFGGTTTIAGIPGLSGTSPTSANNIDQNWTNQHNGRLGIETDLTENMMGRFGYVLTSQVVPKNRARATFSTPGMGHTFTAGAGYKMNEAFDVNWALEYSFASGTGEAPALTGDYKTRAAGFHLGVSYRI